MSGTTINGRTSFGGSVSACVNTGITPGVTVIAGGNPGFGVGSILSPTCVMRGDFGIVPKWNEGVIGSVNRDVIVCECSSVDDVTRADVPFGVCVSVSVGGSVSASVSIGVRTDMGVRERVSVNIREYGCDSGCRCNCVCECCRDRDC